MIHLTYSNRTEELLAALIEAVTAERKRGSPFDPVRLVVPNRSIETYIKHGLAAETGIAANLEITFLQRLAERLARDVFPAARLVDAARIEGHILALLHDEAFMAASVFAPVRAYVTAAGTNPDAVDRRRLALAAELGRLFDEYGASRPELLLAWRERATLADLGAGQAPVPGSEAPAGLAGIERWQRALWLGIFGADGLVKRQASGNPSGNGAPADVLLAEVARALEHSDVAGRPVHVFGVSYIARGYHNLLAALARRTEVRIYTLNPCREFWEDVDSVPELRRRLRREGRQAAFPSRTAGRQAALVLGEDPYELESDRENLALRLWGRPGRENIRLLNDRAGGDFQGRFVSHSDNDRPATLLARLQDDILDRVVSTAPELAAQPDDSLQILPCPGVRRELEVIAAEIWRALASDPTLSLNQIAVVVPEAVKDTYLAHVSAVFAEAHDLPHTIVDLPFGRTSRMAEALLLLLELPFGGFTRRELLPLCTHPALMERFPEARPIEWMTLAEELGIVHGADHADHAGTYIDRDVLNWDQGVRRVVLGAFMDPTPKGAAAAPVRLGEHDYLPLERRSDERASALDFCLLVRSLISDARFAAGKTGPRERPLRQWCDFIRGMAAAYLVPTGPEDEALLARCLSEVEAIEGLPLTDTAVSFRIVADLLARALSAATGGRGQYLAHGVTVTSFVPMRAVPFRVVFVAGLGERAFPASNRRSELDLRAAHRHAGDVTPRQRDLYMFLETLLSARDRLVLSYVARDELTGSTLLPSAVILELRAIIAGGYLGPAGIAALFDRARPPLRRYDDIDRRAMSQLAAREAQAKALGQSLRAALPAGTAPPNLAALERGLPEAIYSSLADRLEAHAAPDSARRGQTATKLVVPLDALRRFLEDPLQGSARFRLRLRETVGDEELVDREDEPFETDRLVRSILLRDAFYDALFAAGTTGLPSIDAVRAAFAKRARLIELGGQGPTGLFGSAEIPGQTAVLEGWLAELGHLGGAALAPTLLRLGRPMSRAPHPTVALPPIELSVPAPEGHGSTNLVVEIVGRTELQIAGPAAGALSFTSRRENSPVKVFRDRLRLFIDHVALAAAGGTPRGNAAHVVWAFGDRHATVSTRFASLPPDVARSYLTGLIGDLVAGASTLSGWASGLHPYLLPCEAVFTARTAGTSVVDEVEKLRDYYFEMPWKTFSSVQGPVPQAADRHDPPPLEEAERMMETRFGLYFDLLEEGASS
jgi:exodeoxyribonuclease V gamma subunit